MYVTDAQQSVVQSFLYAPYGEIISEYNTHVMGEAFPKYSFNAKELDEETGMYYYEARYYAPPTFTSRDPLFEKYPSISPYAYCANNPVKYVDPSGREVEITGEEEQQQQALEDLRNAAPNLKLKYDGNKLIIGEGGVAITEYEKHLAEAINSSEYKSVISLEENKGRPGSYYGTKFDEKNNQYVSLNKVNLTAMSGEEKTSKSVTGSGLVHEITEGLEMGKIAKALQQALGLKNIKIKEAGCYKIETTIGGEGHEIKITNDIPKYPLHYYLYEQGHRRATPQYGERNAKADRFFN